MIVMSKKSFRPSEVLMRLLYKNTHHVPDQIREQMIEYGVGQISYGFANAIYRIRTRSILNHISCCDDEFWVVSRNSVMRDEVIEAVKHIVDLHSSANFAGEEFKIRFGEEVNVWFSRAEEDAKIFGLFRDKYHRMVVKKEPLSKRCA